MTSISCPRKDDRSPMPSTTQTPSVNPETAVTGLTLLEELLKAHSTPGDEGEVAAILHREWEASGFQVQRHGRYAVSAMRPETNAGGRPRMLVCAHMDSPGFTVDAFLDDAVRVIPLGGANFDGDRAPAVLKTAQGPRSVFIETVEDDDARRPSFCIHTERDGIRHGDRVSFHCKPEVNPDGTILSPFLDNRLGCWALCRLAAAIQDADLAVDLVLGATACEEIGGFGAPVLAAAVRPDIVLCIDATYEDEVQGVLVGRGPVLTLSDASVILPPSERDCMTDRFAAAGVRVQTEVYNYSGTDSRAFPHAGLAADVYALLLPTRGNHTPREEGDLGDAMELIGALRLLATRGLSESALNV